MSYIAYKYCCYRCGNIDYLSELPHNKDILCGNCWHRTSRLIDVQITGEINTCVFWGKYEISENNTVLLEMIERKTRP